MSAAKILLLGAACLVIGWLLFFDSKQLPFLARQVVSPSLSKSFEKGSLESLSISHPGEVFQINCSSNSECTLADPPLEPISIAEFKKLIKDIDSLKITSEIAAIDQKQDGGDFGIYQAPLKIEINREQRTILYFGGKNPVTGSRYLKIEGSDSIYTVDDEIFSKLLVKKSELRIKQAVKFTPESITKISASTKTHSHQFLKANDQDESSWKLEKQTVDVDQKLVQEIINRVHKIKIVEFIDSPPPILLQQLDEPYLILTLTEGESTHRLSFYSVNLPEHVAKREGLINRLHFLAIAGKQTILQILPPRLSDFENPPIYFQNKEPFSEITKPQDYTITLASGEIEKTFLGQKTQSQDIKNSLDQLFSALKNTKVISTLGLEKTTPATISVVLHDKNGKIAKLSLHGPISSPNDNQNDAPYRAEILYFSSINVHAIIGADDATSIINAVNSILKVK